MPKILTSLRTTLALLSGLTLLAALGSFAIQLRPEDYASIEEGVLWDWLKAQGAAAPTWWVLGMVFLTALLAVNACCCVVASLLRARRRGIRARTLWAHATHLGFLLVLAGHLIGSVWGFRANNRMGFPGQTLRIAERPGWEFQIGPVRLEYAPEGFPRLLEAAVAVRSGAQTLARGAVRVNHPVTAQGVAFYLKDIRPAPRGWALHLPDGRPLYAEVGRPLPLPGGSSLLLQDWQQLPDGRLVVQTAWVGAGGQTAQDWVAPRPGELLPLPADPPLRWGELAVDDAGIFDVRYDPGAGLALSGGILLSASILPLLWPRWRPG